MKKAIKTWAWALIVTGLMLGTSFLVGCDSMTGEDDSGDSSRIPAVERVADLYRA